MSHDERMELLLLLLGFAGVFLAMVLTFLLFGG